MEQDAYTPVGRERFCIVCGDRHHVSNILSRGLLCVACQTPDLKHESDRVIKNVGMARRRGLPATLTLLEWLGILDFFSWKCAYCRHRFEIMEHIQSINTGGGTTALNVVPACIGCNAHKDRKHVHPNDRISEGTMFTLKQNLRAVKPRIFMNGKNPQTERQYMQKLASHIAGVRARALGVSVGELFTDDQE